MPYSLIGNPNILEANRYFLISTPLKIIVQYTSSIYLPEKVKIMDYLSKKISPFKFSIFLLLVLTVSYLIGMYNSFSFKNINLFSSTLVMDTAQVARNTSQGDFLITKSILPVSYAYFPTITDHPDFIRYPFQVLLYALLFFVFSPSVLIIKMFGFFLYLLNGILIYSIVSRICQSTFEDSSHTQKNNIHLIAVLTAAASSILFSRYFRAALSGDLEIINYTLLMLIINIILKEKTKPMAVGCLFGLLYLTRPNMIVFVAVFTLYLILSGYDRSEWIAAGLKYMLGFWIILSPFVIRSMLLTGEPLFSLQQKIDIIKDVNADLLHDFLYKTFSLPPSALSVLAQNKSNYLLRWSQRAVSAFQYLIDFDKLIYWSGLVMFIYFYKKYRWLVFTYFVFILVHIVVVSNFLKVGNTDRIYSFIFFFFIVLGILGISTFTLFILRKLIMNRGRISLLPTLAVCSLPIITLLSNLGVGISFRSAIPYEFVRAVRGMNLPCVYSDVPYDTAWYLDIPTIYIPTKNESMLTDGPIECEFILTRWHDEELEKFLYYNAKLVRQSGEYELHQLLRP